MTFITTNYGCKDFLEFVSPDFTKFVTPATQNKRSYVVRDFKTEDIISDIPQFALNFEIDPAEGMKRFSWISDDIYKVLDEEGTELIIDCQMKTKQGFNRIQNFDPKAEKGFNYYYNRPPLDQGDVMGRLIRKADIYKSAYYL
jgi:hypothetical protein